MVAVGSIMHPDLALVQRAKARDRAAFNEIVLRYKAKVYNFVRRMVSDVADAEDLTQETFVRAYLSIGSFQSRASLNTWLFRIATNLCIDHSRKSKRTTDNTTRLINSYDGEEDSDREIPDLSFDPQSLLLNSELGSILENALLDLPTKLRAVVLLYDIEGLTYEEIAEVEACPLGTVKSRLFNGRNVLRQKLAPYLRT